MGGIENKNYDLYKFTLIILLYKKKLVFLLILRTILALPPLLGNVK